MIYTCQCGRNLPIGQPGKLRCACGLSEIIFGPIDRADLRQQKLANWLAACIYRGDAIGIADCDCRTKPTVYECGLRGGPCVDRKRTTGPLLVQIGDARPKAMDVQSCRKCDDRTIDDGRIYRDSIRIVTSFSPQRTERQLACLASWQRLGMSIVAVQPEHEIESMAAVYAGVQWLPCDGQRPTIAELAAVAESGPVLLINSDIAIESTMPEFRRNWLANEDKTLRVGCRWEVAADGSQHLQRWGIDAFLITPEMLADFRDLGFRIGQPAWDYWMVIHYASLGYRIRAKIDRGLMHATHTQAWSKAEGREGVAIITDHYGIDRDEQNRRISKLTGRR